MKRILGLIDPLTSISAASLSRRSFSSLAEALRRLLRSASTTSPLDRSTFSRCRSRHRRFSFASMSSCRWGSPARIEGRKDGRRRGDEEAEGRREEIHPQDAHLSHCEHLRTGGGHHLLPLHILRAQSTLNGMPLMSRRRRTGSITWSCLARSVNSSSRSMISKLSSSKGLLDQAISAR